MTTRLKNIALWAAALFVAVQFVQAAIPKITGAPVMVQGFAQMGYPLWFMYALGAAELVGAAALLIPRTATAAAAALAVIMVGAIATHVHFDQPFRTPLVLLVLLIVVGVGRRKHLTDLFSRRPLQDARSSA